MRVIIQPAANEDSRKHFEDTVENPVDLILHKELLGINYEPLFAISKIGKIALWGVTPGKNGANESKYKKLSIGDVVFFTGKNKVFCTAEISYLFNNEKLARNIWGLDSRNQTWENMYALSNVVKRDIPYSALRAAIGSATGDNFMGFRPLDQVKSMGALSLIGIQDLSWDIKVGEVIKRKDLHDRYGGGRYGGIEPSAKTPSVFLFTSSMGGVYGYNFDEELEDGSFLYTGDGQVGDQDLQTGGNKAIFEHQSKGRTLRLFEQATPKNYVRYLGEFEFNNSSPDFRIAPDRDGNQRKVLVFKLSPVGATKFRERSSDQKSEVVSATLQEPEKNVANFHERSTSASTTFATRTEAQLQNRYSEYLKKKGKVVKAFKIEIPESNAPLKTDLVNVTDLKIIEVKAGITRGYIREAIGQVLDYVYQLKRTNNENWKPAILLPGKPTSDLVELIKSLSIELIWEDEDGFKSY